MFAPSRLCAFVNFLFSFSRVPFEFNSSVHQCPNTFAHDTNSLMSFGGYGQRQGGGGLRLILGVIIALVALFEYLHQTSVNPVTGQTQHISMTADQETQLGLQSAPRMAAEMGGEVPADNPRTQLVREVGERVSSGSDAAKSPYHFQFHLLADQQTVNAFALPGGQVFITRGLLDRLENEAELAGVLGHECGHVVARHAGEQLAKSQLGQSLVLATGVAASDRNNGYSAAMIANVVNQMTQLRFSREDESAADMFGLRFMTQAGYDPRAMLGVMKILEDISKGGRQPEFLQTHPYPEARYAAIQEFLQKNYPNGVPGNLTVGKNIRL
jgi:beta-barrel assembly-enhancing protease